MRIPVKQNGARFGFEIRHNFGRPGVDLMEYLNDLPDKQVRQVVRKMVAAAGTQLAKEIRNQIKRRDMPYSRARNAAERRKARESGQKPLLRTITTRTWSKAHKGLIGAVVGPRYPEGAHGHLVEFGHRIKGHAKIRNMFSRKGRKIFIRKRTRNAGTSTVAHHFQQDAGEAAQWNMYNGMFNAMQKWLAKLHNPTVKAK